MPVAAEEFEAFKEEGGKSRIGPEEAIGQIMQTTIDNLSDFAAGASLGERLVA